MTRPDPTATRRFHPPPTLVALGLILFTVAAYFPALRAGYIWDDDAYLTQNKLVQSPAGLARIWFEPRASPQYYPLVFTTFWLEHSLWGLHPAGYHLNNVLLHAAGALLVWRMLLRWSVPGAPVAAMVFALHPIHVESVAWITERKNVLSGFLYLAALSTYLRHGTAVNPPHVLGRPTRRDYFLSLLLFTAALLSKSVTASLPAAILLILYWLRGRIHLADVGRLLPFFILGALAAAHTAWLEKHHVGADLVAWGLSPLEKCLLAGRVLWSYLATLLWPAELIFFYPRWRIDATDPRHWLYPLGVLVLFTSSWLARRRFGRGPLVAMLFYCGTLFPVLGFFKVYPMLFSYVADHFAYLASLGVIVLVIVLAARVTAKCSTPHVIRPTLSAAVLLACAVMTWNRCHVFVDEETLWRDTIARNPEAWAAYNNLGTLLYERGDKEEAFQCYARAVELNPTYVVALDSYGTMLVQRGRVDEAFEVFRRAVDSDPYYPAAQRNLGMILCDRGDFDNGLRHLKAALILAPDSWEAHEEMANGLYKAGRLDEALAHYRKLLDLRPDDATGLCNYAVALAALGKIDEARSSLDKALTLDPRHAPSLHARATLFADQSRWEEAISQEQAALAVDPKFVKAHQGLAVALAASGKLDQAVEHFRRAAELEPNDANHRFNLARALDDLGRRTEALREYEEVLRLNPKDIDARARAETLRRAGP